MIGGERKVEVMTLLTFTCFYEGMSPNSLTMSTSPSGAADKSQRLDLGARVRLEGQQEWQCTPERRSEDEVAQLVTLFSKCYKSDH